MQVTNLSNTASLIYNSLLAFSEHFGDDDRAVNWCGELFVDQRNLAKGFISICPHEGFYLDSQLFPGKKRDPKLPTALLLAPFCGKPACQIIYAKAGKGVCADAFVSCQPLLVPNVGECFKPLVAGRSAHLQEIRM